MRPLAAFGVIAMLAGRAVAPASEGIGVGLNRTIRAIEIGGGAASQLYAMAATVVTLAEVLVMSRSRAPGWIRTLAVIFSGFAVLVTLAAAATRNLPGISAGIAGFGASVLCIAVGVYAFRVPFARPVALGAGAVGVGALARLVSAALAFAAARGTSGGLFVAARSFATVAFLFDAAALIVAMAWLTARSKRLASPIVALAFLAAVLATREYLRHTDDPRPLLLLVRRAVDRLLTHPDPFVPVLARAFVAVLAPALAFACVVARGVFPVLAGGLALVMLGEGAPEMPLAALSMIVGAIAIALGAHDERALWASIRHVEKQGGPPGTAPHGSAEPRPEAETDRDRA